MPWMVQLSLRAKFAFKEQMRRVRENMVVWSVNRLLAEKGFDAMAVDEVAADAGITKASLCKHFDSKEELAAAAMVQVPEQALEVIVKLELDNLSSPLAHLKAVARWTMQVQLAGEMPSPPAQSPALRSALMTHQVYLGRLMGASDKHGVWIAAAQAAGQHDPKLPPELALYTLFARACDPVLGLLRAVCQYSDEWVIEM